MPSFCLFLCLDRHEILATGLQRVPLEVAFLAEVLAALPALILPAMVTHGALMRAQIRAEKYEVLREIFFVFS